MLVKPIALTPNLDEVRVVHEPVEKRRNGRRVTKELGPVEFVARSLPAATLPALPWVNASEIPWLGPEGRKVVDRFLAPLLCTMTATCRHNEYTKNLALQVRAGNMERIIGDAQLVKQWADQVGRSISFGKVSHESA